MPNSDEHRIKYVGTIQRRNLRPPGMPRDEWNKQHRLRMHGQVEMTNSAEGVAIPLKSGFLNLHGWELRRIVETDDSIQAYAAYIEEDDHKNPCPGCGVLNEWTRFGTREQPFADLPSLGKPVAIVTDRQRFRCKACGRTWMNTLPHMDETRIMTKRLLKYIQERSLREPFTHIAKRVGVDEKTVRTLFAEYAERLEAQYAHRPLPRWLGIDELYLVRKYRCILTDIESREPFDMLPFRTSKVLERYFAHKPATERAAVELVTMDMWNPYREVTRQFLPNAQIVVDKFHVLRYANIAMEQVRKRIRHEFANQRRQLKKDRYILLRRRHDLDAKDELVLQTWIENFKDLGLAYQFKEAIYLIWETAQSWQEAESLYDEWVADLPESIRPNFNEMTRAISNWRSEVFAYFDFPVTNAFTESMNGIVKQVNRAGRGYSFPAIRVRLLYSNKPDQP